MKLEDWKLDVIGSCSCACVCISVVALVKNPLRKHKRDLLCRLASCNYVGIPRPQYGYSHDRLWSTYRQWSEIYCTNRDQKRLLNEVHWSPGGHFTQSSFHAQPLHPKRPTAAMAVLPTGHHPVHQSHLCSLHTLSALGACDSKPSISLLFTVCCVNCFYTLGLKYAFPLFYHKGTSTAY